MLEAGEEAGIDGEVWENELWTEGEEGERGRDRDDRGDVGDKDPAPVSTLCPCST